MTIITTTYYNTTNWYRPPKIYNEINCMSKWHVAARRHLFSCYLFMWQNFGLLNSMSKLVIESTRKWMQFTWAINHASVVFTESLVESMDLFVALNWQFIYIVAAARQGCVVEENCDIFTIIINEIFLYKYLQYLIKIYILFVKLFRIHKFKYQTHSMGNPGRGGSSLNMQTIR